MMTMAKGLVEFYYYCNTFDTFFGLHLSHLIFSATEQTSRSLQGQDTSVQEAVSVAKLPIAFITS